MNSQFMANNMVALLHLQSHLILRKKKKNPMESYRTPPSQMWPQKLTESIRKTCSRTSIATEPWRFQTDIISITHSLPHKCSTNEPPSTQQTVIICTHTETLLHSSLARSAQGEHNTMQRHKNTLLRICHIHFTKVC